MNIIEKYKNKKELKKDINIVLNSEFDYKNHDLNILKECLNIWSKDNEKYATISFDWIYTDPSKKEKVYFVKTNLKELKQFKLENIINNDIVSTSYMTSKQSVLIFSRYINDD